MGESKYPDDESESQQWLAKRAQGARGKPNDWLLQKLSRCRAQDARGESQQVESEREQPDVKKDANQNITPDPAWYLEKPKQEPSAEGIAVFLFIILVLIIVVNYQFLSLNVQQENYVSANKISGDNYLEFTCHLKPLCEDFAKVRLSCAEAGSIQKCIEIRMKGDDYHLCTEDGNISDIDEKLMPSFAQCTGHKILSFVNRK